MSSAGRASRDDDLRGELGDLLFQVVFLARIAGETGRFTFDDVARGASPKNSGLDGDAARDGRPACSLATGGGRRQTRVPIRGHRGSAARRSRPVSAVKVRVSELDEIPLAAPALARARTRGRRAARMGFDSPSSSAVCAKLDDARGGLAERLEPALAGAVEVSFDDEIGQGGIDRACVSRGAR